MNIGDYVRTNEGIIGKLIKIHEKHPYPTEWIIEVNTKKEVVLECDNHSVIKSSPNIIDLIEVGDYVNGCKVIDNNYCYMIYDDDFEFGENKMKGSLLLENQVIINCGFEINSIVTKKQFERKEYMKCNKCGSDRVNIQITSKTKKKGGIIRFMVQLMLFMFTLVFWAISLLIPKHTKVVNKKMAVCQNCGNVWGVR